jgi:Xaa-Pro dipeptidase
MLKHPLVLYRGETFNPNFCYFSGVDIDHAFFVLNRGKKTLFVPKLNEKLARKEFDGKVIVYNDLWKELKKAAGKSTIYADYSSMSVSLFEKLKKSFRVENASEILSVKRMVKENDEIAKISKAVSITKEIFASIDFKKMKTENDVRKFILKQTLELGVEPAFAPIVATDRNSSFPHYTPADVKLGSMVLVDYGVKYQNYCADLTRCFFLKKDKKIEEAKKNYGKLKDVFHDIIDNFGDFETGAELAKFSSDSMKKHGLPKMIHSIGHGIGLEVHELPRLSEKFKDKLKGSALAIEPACYFSNYGLRYEETIYFNGKRARVL